MLQSRFSKAQDRQYIPFPAGWTWTDAPITIYRNAKGEICTDFDVVNFAPTGTKRTYYVATDGDAGNDGLTPATAINRIRDAITKDDADIDVIEVIIAEGHYNETTGWAGQTPTKNLIVKAAPGATVISSNHRNITGLTRYEETDVYYGTRNGTENVADLKYTDDDGNYLGYKKVTSLEDVIATPGSWWRSSSTTPYIHTIDGRQPDSDIIITSSQDNGYVTGDVTVYLENIKFLGGEVAFCASVGAKVFAKNCVFGTAKANGFGTFGTITYLQNCSAPYNLRDGFNYHESGEISPFAIEVDCIGTYNGGLTASDADNGSSMHGGGKIIRVNCEYHNNKGTNCIDVNPGTQSWNIGCIVHDSAGVTTNHDFSIQRLGTSGDEAEMWLDDCIAYGSTSGLYIGADSIAYVRNSHFATETVVGTRADY